MSYSLTLSSTRSTGPRNGSNRSTGPRNGRGWFKFFFFKLPKGSSFQISSCDIIGGIRHEFMYSQSALCLCRVRSLLGSCTRIFFQSLGWGGSFLRSYNRLRIEPFSSLVMRWILCMVPGTNARHRFTSPSTSSVKIRTIAPVDHLNNHLNILQAFLKRT